MARAPVVQEIEAPPEADRLDGFPHPRMTAQLFGHVAPQQAMAQAFAAGRVHHAWLIAGPRGIGKATLAYQIARYALARPEERGLGVAAAGGGGSPLAVAPLSVAGRQVRALSHPGLMLIRRPWEPKGKRLMASITVDEVRRLKSFLTHSAAPDTWRVVIVDQADELNINAANALLKSLEEPPARALFLLVSSEPGRLLTTIRSRCRRVQLEPLGPEDLRRAAEAAMATADEPPKLPADGEWARLMVAAQGSVRRLLALAETDGAKLNDKMRGLVGLLPKVDWSQIHSLSDELVGPGAEQRFEQFFTQLLDFVGRLVRARAVDREDSDDGRLAARLIPAHGLATWAELWETVHAKKAETLALNLDRKSLILETIARMQAAARG